MSPSRVRSAMPSLGARLASGGAWAFAGRLLAAPVAIGIVALSARLLAPEELGTYLLAANVVGIVVAVSCLGQDLVVVRFVAEEFAASRAGRIGPLVRRSATIVAVGSVSAAIVWLAGGGEMVASVVRAPELSTVGGLVALWIVSVALLRLWAEAFRGLHDIRFASLFAASGQSPGLAAGTILVLGLLVLWQFSSRSGLVPVVLVTVAATSFSALVAGWIFLHRLDGPVPDGSPPGGEGWTTRKLLATGLPLSVSKISLLVLLQADLLILAALRPQAEVAVYGVASRLVVIAGIPLAIANAILPPMIAELNSAGETDRLERLLRGSATITSLPAVLVLALFVVWGRPLLGLLYGAEYRTAWVVLVILGLGKVVNVAMGSCGQVLAMTGLEKAAMGINLSSGVVTVAAAVFLGTAFGAVGVAAAMAVAMVLQNALRLVFARRHLGLWTHATLAPADLLRIYHALLGFGRSVTTPKVRRPDAD